jgi:eukaryotic-like serine/threonine-protein kinase
MSDDASWEKLSLALDRALDLQEADRGTWLAQLAGDDPDLAARLTTILSGSAPLQQQRFLDGDACSTAVEMASPNLAGTRVGPFTIEAEAGHGGMGTVWRARRDDGKFNQTVAIKFLASPWADREGQARFQREVRLLSRLDHPNIARLIDAGFGAANQPYLVMEFVEGERIDEYCRRLALGIPATLHLFLQLLDALALAHRQLIVHRDLKPSNVMVTRDGVPKLLDFGIARLLEDSSESEQLTRHTRAGPMTPGYAAPEQLLGEPADTLADVYALGVLLHELLTGVRPYDEPGQSAEARFQAIMEDRLPLASSRPQASRALRGDLDNIIAKALRRQRRDRYASVTDLADDIKRYLAHEPVVARAPTLLYRTSRFIRRNRLGVAIGSIAILAVATALITALIQQGIARQQSARATRELSYAQATHEFLSAILQQGADKPMTTQQLLDSGESLIDRQFAATPDLRARLLYALAEQYGSLDQAATAQTLLRKAQPLAAASQDRGLAARVTCDLAESLGYTGSVDQAIKMIDSVLPTIQAKDWTSVRASCLSSRGNIHAGASHSAEAERDLRTALQLFDPNDPGDDRSILNAREALAGVLALRGQSSAAAREYRDLLASVDKLGRNNTSLALKYMNNYGIVLINAGQYLEASRVFEQALHRQADIDTGQLGDPAVFANAAGVLTLLRRPKDALALYATAADLAKRNGLRNWLAALPMRQGNAYCIQGDLVHAEEEMRAAAPLVADMFPPLHSQTALFHLAQGCVARLRGDPGGAREHYRQALAIDEALGLSGSLRATALTGMANSSADAHDWPAAAISARQAEVLAREALGDFNHSQSLGNALLTRARIQKAQQENFTPTLAAAVIELQASVGDDATQSMLAAAGFPPH